MQMTFKQIHLTHRWDLNSYYSFGYIGSERVIYTPQIWNLTIRYSLVSYPEHPFFWWGGFILREMQIFQSSFSKSCPLKLHWFTSQKRVESKSLPEGKSVRARQFLLLPFHFDGGYLN